MKSAFKKFVAIMAIASIISSCEKDEGKLPNISFKTGTGYTALDATVVKNADVKIGITASKAEDKDVLKKFTISKAIGSAANTTAFTKDLSGSDGDNYNYEYSFKSDTTSGQVSTYTFTVTNRDGLVNQVSVKLTVQ